MSSSQESTHVVHGANASGTNQEESEVMNNFDQLEKELKAGKIEMGLDAMIMMFSALNKSINRKKSSDKI